MPTKKILLYLFILFAIALCLRIYKINSLPAGTHSDEASWGYNAYSIAQTGKDEHGVSFPLIFQAYGDQKLPVFIYSIVPFIKLFGLGNLAVRLPAAIAGSLLVILLFFLLKQLKFTEEISFIGAFILATNPWGIFLSRIFGYDSSFGLFFYTLAILLSLLAYKKNKLILYILAGLCFGITWYCYIAYRLITPLTLFSFIFIFERSKRFIKINGLIFLGVFLIAISPLIYMSFTGNGTARFNQAMTNPMTRLVMEVNENRYFCTERIPRILCNMNDNKLKSYIQSVFAGYIKTFSPYYLFIEESKDVGFLNINKYGLFYPILLPFYLAGFVYLWLKTVKFKTSKYELFVLCGLIITPLSCLLVGDPQKVRLSGLLPFIVISLTYGLAFIDSYIKQKMHRFYYLSVIICLLAFTSLFIVDFFIIHLQKNEIYYQNHISKLMKYLATFDKKTQIYIASIDEGIIYYAYVNKVDPYKFQRQVKRNKPNNDGFAHAIRFENIHIDSAQIDTIYCQTKNNGSTTLYVTNEDLVKSNKVSNIKNIIYNENKSLRMLFVYDVSDITKNIKCN